MIPRRIASWSLLIESTRKTATETKRGPAKVDKVAGWSLLIESTLSGRLPCYMEAIEELAAKLRPRLESGEIAPWIDICARALAPTFQLAYVVLAVSPHQQDLDGSIPLYDARLAAGQCIMSDVVDVARRRGWLPAESLRRARLAASSRASSRRGPAAQIHTPA